MIMTINTIVENAINNRDHEALFNIANRLADKGDQRYIGIRESATRIHKQNQDEEEANS